MVIWFIGLSGVGKTTLGRMLETHYKRLGLKAFVLDGDVVRSFFDGDLGYTKTDRIANIKRILLAAHALSESGVTVIVCNISPFEELREFARQKLVGYVEIYLKRDLSNLRRRDTKKVYQGIEVVGVDVGFDDPMHPDLVIDTGNETSSESFDRVIALLGVPRRI